MHASIMPVHSSIDHGSITQSDTCLQLGFGQLGCGGHCLRWTEINAARGLESSDE
jgi:hypothetical protein